ncbi:MAG: endonuclease III domain-containing protein [Methanobacteriaceae archaeon]
MNLASNLTEIYNKLLETYSPQGWWPFLSHDGVNPTKTGSINGYHPKDYSFPKNKSQVFEVALGAILTQNTAWTSVENALINLNNFITTKLTNLKEEDYILSPENIIAIYENDNNGLKDAIRCAGFVNQKTEYIKNIAEFFIDLDDNTPKREEILKVKGVGNETADSILLYGFKQAEFVVDAYTTRIFTHLGYIDNNGNMNININNVNNTKNVKSNYSNIKKLFEDNLKGNSYDLDTVIMFQEYHALIVEHGKRYYTKTPYGIEDTALVDYFSK